MHVQVSTLSKTGKLIEAFKLPFPESGFTVKSLIQASIIRKMDQMQQPLHGASLAKKGTLTLEQERAIYFAYRAFEVKKLIVEVNQQRLLRLDERIPVTEGVAIQLKGMKIFP